ncbi:hypothetical protein ACFLU5_07250 [Bacteroidota bacterium]
MKNILFKLSGLITLISILNCSTPHKNDKGFLRVDKNSRYFVFDDGTSYVPIGFNKFVFYQDTESDIDSLLDLWSSHGVNYIRVWVGGGSEPEFPVGIFDEIRMKKLDYIIEKCEEYGVYLSLCFWNENNLRFDVGYGWNNARQGYNMAIDSLGTTDNPENLKGVEHLPSWNAMKNRYKVFVNRRNHHKGIMMWDLVNDGKKTEEWKKQMYDYVRSLDPNDHMIGFQYNTGRDPKGEMDLGSVRVYEYNPGGNDAELMAKALFDRILEALHHGDPVYAGEGRMHCGEASEYELERFYLHTLWGPISVGAAGNLHAWVCETKEGRWPDYTMQELKWMKNYSDFCQTVNWSEFNSRNMNDLASCENENVLAYACGDKNQMLIYLLNDDPEDNFDKMTTTLNLNVDLKNTPYKMEWIDIRTGDVIEKQAIKSFPAEIDVPEFRDGIFAHLKN